MQSVTFDLGNELIYQELVGGTKQVLLVDRQASGSVTLEAPTLAQKDFFAAALTDTSLGNLQFTHGTAAGNIVQFTSSKVDIGDVNYGDIDGIASLEIPYTLVPSTSGNDEFSIIYT